MHRITLPILLAATTAPHGIMAIANDECADAEVLLVGSGCAFTSGSWTDATQSLAPIACSGSTSATANDAWYAFTATGEHTVVRVQSDSSNDAVVEVLGGDCASLVSIACADAALLGGTESLTLNTAAGTTYRVRVYWWDYGTAPSSLSFGICVEEGAPSPVNDDCSSVISVDIPIGSSATFTGTTVGADTIGDHLSTSIMTTGSASVWHAFTIAECAHVRISYCGTLPPFSAAWSLLATTCPADSVVFADALDLVACGNGNVSLTFDSLPAGTWYVPVLSAAIDAWGPYELVVSVNTCFTGLLDRQGPAEWSATIDGDRLLVVPGSSSVASIDLFGPDGRQFQHVRTTATAGCPILVPIRDVAHALLIARISTPAGRKTLRLVRQMP